MPPESLSNASVLTINAGSSSLKFSLFRAGETLQRVLAGKFERIGLPDGELSVTDFTSAKPDRRNHPAPTHVACVPTLMELVQQRIGAAMPMAIGHRVVHGGMRYGEPERVSDEMLLELRRLSPFAPEHLPAEISLIEELGRQYPRVPQVACFDTAFHHDLPRVAKLLPIPRRYLAMGVQRYGFHGLSYTYLMQELERVAGVTAAAGRVVLAHLGHGASMAAVRNGKCIDTTMAFTPAAGLMMSTRSGDLDPGLVAYFARTEGMNAEQFDEMVNAKSGLLGVSEISSDTRDLQAREKSDVRAAEALALFCYQAKKWMGALAATLGGLDTLVFAGGIGENSASIRARICDGLGFLGIELEQSQNEANASVITKKSSKTIVRVIPTDEELFIAQCACTLLKSK